MAPIRLVFMGTPPLAAQILAGLLAARTRGLPAYDVVGVWTQPDRVAGRGRKLQPSAVKVLAQAHGLPVYQPTRLRDGSAEAALQKAAADVVVVAAYGRILPLALLQVAPHGCVNVHASLLPRWRGASPIAHSILYGDATSGVSIMRMDEGCDTGPVFARATLTLAAAETTATLTDRLAELGRDTLLATLPQIVAGTLAAQIQPSEGVTHAGMLQKSDGALDFGEDAAVLARKIRALTPWPSAYAAFAGQRFIIVAAHPAPDDDTAYTDRAGEVLAADGKGLRVACGRGSLWIEAVKPAGAQQMHAAQWIGGRGPKRGATLVKVS